MLDLVRVALKRPYTFVVLALLILIVGPLAALRTPVDIFPEIRIPVIAVVWQYTGLPPDQMSGRVMLQFQRSLTTTVNDIEHIEGTSYTGIGIVKVFFQPGADIRTANAQVTAISQTVLKQMPPNITPPLILNYNAVDRADHPARAGRQGHVASRRCSTSPSTRCARRWSPCRAPRSRSRSAASSARSRSTSIPAAMQARGLSANDVANALAAQNLLTPVGTQKIGGYEYAIQLNNAPTRLRGAGRPADLRRQRHRGLSARRGARCATATRRRQNIVHVDGSRSVLLQVLKNGATSTLVDHRRHQAARRGRCSKSLPDNVTPRRSWATSRCSSRARSAAWRMEAVIAAVLTSLMILLFLGSWRSTVIIAISIPLAILGSIALLAAFGETLNIMTLGGLALAVGILVDDATVTIENINWHLEQGKDVETADHGRRARRS